jgi:hypothetical protein
MESGGLWCCSQPHRRHSLSCLQPTPSGSLQAWRACVALSQSELSHVRHVITKAELDDVYCTGDDYLHRLLAEGKMCFVCQSTKFTFFGRWGTSCNLCHRMVCDKCQSKIRMPQEYLSSIPVFTLCPKDSQLSTLGLQNIRNQNRGSISCLPSAGHVTHTNSQWEAAIHSNIQWEAVLQQPLTKSNLKDVSPRVEVCLNCRQTILNIVRFNRSITQCALASTDSSFLNIYHRLD